MTKAFEKYRTAIVGVPSKKIRPLFERHSKELGEVLLNRLFDTGGPTSLQHSTSKNEQFFIKMFYGLTEITNSFDTLKDIETYINRFPFSKSKVTKLRYLCFVIESYLNEMYILHQRLINYLNLIKKAYSKSSRKKEILTILDPLYRLVSSAFKSVSLVRGAHVHEYRFSDKEIDRLRALELLSSKSDEPVLSLLFRMGYSKARLEWRKTVISNNVSIRTLFNSYFAALHPVMFDSDGNMRYP